MISRRLFIGLLGGLGVTTLIDPRTLVQEAHRELKDLPIMWARLNGLDLSDYLTNVQVTRDQPVIPWVDSNGWVVYKPDGPINANFRLEFYWPERFRRLHDILWEGMSSPLSLEVGYGKHGWKSKVIAQEYFWRGVPNDLSKGDVQFLATGPVESL